MDGNASKQRVAYYYDSEVGNYYYGPGHPMKPHRIRMTHNLVLHYGLYREMEVFRPRKTSDIDMEVFHSDDYIEFLKNVSPETKNEMLRDCKRFAVGDDCPVFHGLYDYCQLYTGGSVGGAVQLNYKTSDVVVNWAGGLHHAKKSEASGFCYVNDIVLAILELLKFHERVLYIDIDIHHGDGVEEAFYTTDRVMTVSFHKFGDFFPGTGDLHDMGTGAGKFYAINAPLKDGMDDEAYSSIFMPVMEKVMEVFRPQAIVFQAGADSLAGDRLGVFNLSIHGHAACLQFMQSFGVPMLVLGGGGYTIRNVARCWTYETGCLLGKDLNDKLPPNEYYEYFAPNFELHIDPSNMENKNGKEHLERIRKELMERLDRLPRIPSTGFQHAPAALKEDEVPEEDPDHRGGGKLYRERTKAYDEDEGELEDDSRAFGRNAGRSHRELDFSKQRPSGEGKAGAEGAAAAARGVSANDGAAEPMEVDGDTAAAAHGSGPGGVEAAGEESRQGASGEAAKVAQEVMVSEEEEEEVMEEEEEVLVEEEVDEEEEEEIIVEERESDEDVGTPGSSAGEPPAPVQATREPPAAS